MQRPVAVGLGVGDVVLDHAHRDVGLLGEGGHEAVDIGDEGADDPHAGDVGDVLAQGRDLQLHALPGGLLEDRLGALDPGGDVLDRVVEVQLGELLAQDLQSRRHLLHAEAVAEHHPGEVLPDLREPTHGVVGELG